ncbi:unnamed protein product [Caretta caretta]
MISMLELVKDSRMRQAFCGVLEKWSRAMNGYFTNWEKCPVPRMGESQFCNDILPLYCHVTSNWLTCEELELKQAIIKALGPMMGILLHKKEPQNLIFKEISWPLEQYKEKIDVFHVTKSLSQLLEVSGEYKIPLPKAKFQAICSALHNQTKQLSIENHKELFHCVLLLARSSLDDLLAFLHEQLEIEHEAVRVASLDLLRAIVGADLPETRVKKLLIVKAVKSPLSDQNATVRKAALHFIRTLLSSGSVENCAAWDLVAYVFSKFSVSTSKLGTTLLTQDVEEESTIQTLCIDILQCLDTSVNGMTQGDTTELWRSLGGEPLLATQVLQVLIEKIKTPTRTEGSITSETEIDRHLATAEPLSATCAIFEVVSACSRTKLCGNCSQSCFLFSCSRSAKPSDKRCLCQREAARGDSEKDYNLLRATLAESVLFKGGNERLVRVPRKQRTWILLENPKTHHEGVCLLVSLLLRSGLITPEIIQRLLPWVNSPTENH